jgi:hypothetical protein
MVGCQPSASAAAMLAALSSMNSIEAGAWPDRCGQFEDRRIGLHQPFGTRDHDVAQWSRIGNVGRNIAQASHRNW